MSTIKLDKEQLNQLLKQISQDNSATEKLIKAIKADNTRETRLVKAIQELTEEVRKLVNKDDETGNSLPSQMKNKALQAAFAIGPDKGPKNSGNSYLKMLKPITPNAIALKSGGVKAASPNLTAAKADASQITKARSITPEPLTPKS